MDSVHCAECGENLTGVEDRSAAGRTPCPRCGATVRRIAVSVTEGVVVSDHVSAVKRTQGKVVGFTESLRRGLASSADQSSDGTHSFTMLGLSPQGEADTLPACHILVQHLNTAGASWTDVRLGSEEPADCEADATDDPSRVLRIQVVRAIREDLWRELATSGRVARVGVEVGELVEAIRGTLRHKTVEKPILPSIRGSLHLALDATRLPTLGFDDVASEVRSRLGPECASLGFAAVWLVGPVPSLTWRLDS